jgi:hypothetical protein
VGNTTTLEILLKEIIMTCDILHIRSTGVTYTTGTLTITIPSVTLTNGQVFTLTICQSIPTITAGDNPQVVVTDGSSTYDLYLQMGNYVRASGLKSRRRLTLVYGTDPAHITVLSPCLRG